jgi:hypothetical protein
MSSQWFSARLRRVCLVGGQESGTTEDSVVLFVAVWFDDAFQRALALGYEKEEEYRNGEGEIVQWKFQSVLTLDIIPELLESGTEVHSMMHLPGDLVSGSAEVPTTPEASKPSQTM